MVSDDSLHFLFYITLFYRVEFHLIKSPGSVVILPIEKKMVDKNL